MFHNIFSTKEQTLEKKTAIVDNREKNSLVPSELVKLNFELQFEQLIIGDYVINNNVIERKSIPDLKSSIINKRIFAQLKEIRKYEKALLIIEGDKEQLFNNEIISANAVRGFIISAQLDFKVPVIFSEDERDTAKIISILSKRDPNKVISLIQKKTSPSPEVQKLNILQSFPGIGPTTAEKLIKKFKSIKNIINSNYPELSEIIGKRAEKFLSLLD